MAREKGLFIWYSKLVGGLEHVLFAPIVGMMIQSDQYFSEGLNHQPEKWLVYIIYNIYTVNVYNGKSHEHLDDFWVARPDSGKAPYVS